VKRGHIAIAVTVLALSFSVHAYADLVDIVLTQSTQTGWDGTTLTFVISLTNTTGSTIFLDGAGITTSSSFLTMTDNPFLANAPLSLAPGATTGPFAAFTVLIAPGSPAGSYALNDFSILGGTSGSFDVIGSAAFTVNVAPDLDPVPEPSTAVLLSAGLIGIGVKRRFATDR